jgi:hypothetical protein
MRIIPIESGQVGVFRQPPRIGDPDRVCGPETRQVALQGGASALMSAFSNKVVVSCRHCHGRA